MLSADVVHGVLQIGGTSRRDVIDVSLSGGRIVVEANGHTRSFTASGVESINILAGGGPPAGFGR